MKIFFFGSDYAPTGGGIATYTQEFLGSLIGEPRVVGRVKIFGNREPRTFDLSENITVTTVQSVNFFYVGFQILWDMLGARDYDVYHSFNLFPVGFWVVFWSRALGKKSILTFHGADACDRRTSKKVLFLEKLSIVHATRAITVSNFTKNKVVERFGISGKNIEVMYSVLPRFEKIEGMMENVREKFGIAQDDFVILTVARLVKRKGVEYVIEALSKINDPKVKLIIAGDGKERASLEALVLELKISERIFFAGKVPRLTPYYKTANIFVLASYIIEEEGDFEGLGLVLLEAQSHGLPVVGTQSGGIPEAFEKGKTGLLVPERDAQALADAFLRLKKDKQLSESMSTETSHFLAKRFGRDIAVGRYLKLLSVL